MYKEIKTDPYIRNYYNINQINVLLDLPDKPQSLIISFVNQLMG